MRVTLSATVDAGYTAIVPIEIDIELWLKREPDDISMSAVSALNAALIEMVYGPVDWEAHPFVHGSPEEREARRRQEEQEKAQVRMFARQLGLDEPTLRDARGEPYAPPPKDGPTGTDTG